MSQIGDIRDALAEALQTLPGTQVNARQTANFTPPAVLISRGPFAYHEAMEDGVSVLTIRVQVLVGLVSDKGAQLLLDEYVSVSGDRSVKAALESDPTLGGLVSDLIVTVVDGEQEYVRAQGTHQQGGSPVLGSQFTVEIRL